jgi:3-deoxy-7-phosphoheptulonate synthase
MMIIMKPGCTQAQIDNVLSEIEKANLTPHISTGVHHTIIGAIGDSHHIPLEKFELIDGVDNVRRITQPFKLASRQFYPDPSSFALDGFTIGSEDIIIIAGPCAVESRSQLLETAHAVREAGANALRGGVFKPRTSPYSFQGLGEEGLKIMAEAREQTSMPVVVEITSLSQLDLMVQYVDVLQVGARNMQNFPLLHTLGTTRMPVLIKRGMSATVEELLMSAEYVLSGGNQRVILCERGIRTFETSTRNTTDINAIPVLKSLTHLPVILDPSHSTGYREFVPAVARSAVAAGADGLIVEVHRNPVEALSDGRQSLRPEEFFELVKEVKLIASAIGRRVAPVRSITAAD